MVFYSMRTRSFRPNSWQDFSELWKDVTLEALKHCIKTGDDIQERKIRNSYKFDKDVKREKTNKMQQSDVYYQLLSQHVSGIIMPIFRKTKTVLLHMVYCSGSAGCGW